MDLLYRYTKEYWKLMVIALVLAATIEVYAWPHILEAVSPAV
jgi:uncharacterized membrane protein YraQ (UPF0718 family)